MTAWMRVAGLAVALSIAESCSLKSPEMPRLDVSADAARIKVVARLPGADRLGVDDIARQLAAERPEHVVDGHLRAGLAHRLAGPDAVRREDHPVGVQVQDRVAGLQRLLLEDVQRGAGDPARADRAAQRRLVDDRPA